MGAKIVIVGGVAGGATAAARARRISETAEITLLERGPYVSFANCGLPYYISGAIVKRSKLFLQTPEGFDARYGVKVLVDTEAIEIDRGGTRVRVLGPEGESWLPYDKLILAQGGNPIMPPLPGVGSPNVFKLWTVPDVDRIKAYLETHSPGSALIAGSGFIGLEMAEAFRERGLATTVVELLPRIMSTMDPEFGAMIATKLEEHGVRVVTGLGLKAIHGASGKAELSDGSLVDAGIVLLSIGIRPELALAKAAGLAVGASGGLEVDEELRTSDLDIYAAGDMIEVLHKVSGRKVRVPLAGPANRQGRIAASNALGMHMKYHGALGTSVFKAFDGVAASTGLSERAAREAGFDVGAAIVYKDNHASYYPGGKELVLKIVYDRKSSRLLGAQAFGSEGVEKRIDVLATALHGKMTLDDIAELDLAYAPPFSSANDPVNVAAFVAQNDVSGYSPLETAAGLKAALAAAGSGGPPALVLDVRNVNEYEEGHIAGSLNLPLDELRFRLDEVPRNVRIHIHCRSGFRAHLALRILNENGYEAVVNVTGGYMAVLAEGGFDLVQAYSGLH
ncbi:MAG: FAD-dependent oxidoreductase [Rectinemataceae bacterium]|jgi:NADPH-dependent 2,4-dienoyl-CoA reductase/sulfur reductase-like enzyme/rhodanese-related sulfurtransferase